MLNGRPAPAGSAPAPRSVRSKSVPAPRATEPGRGRRWRQLTEGDRRAGLEQAPPTPRGPGRARRPRPRGHGGRRAPCGGAPTAAGPPLRTRGWWSPGAGRASARPPLSHWPRSAGQWRCGTATVPRRGGWPRRCIDEFGVRAVGIKVDVTKTATLKAAARRSLAEARDHRRSRPLGRHRERRPGDAHRGRHLGRGARRQPAGRRHRHQGVARVAARSQSRLCHRVHLLDRGPRRATRTCRRTARPRPGCSA